MQFGMVSALVSSFLCVSTNSSGQTNCISDFYRQTSSTEESLKCVFFSKAFHKQRVEKFLGSHYFQSVGGKYEKRNLMVFFFMFNEFSSEREELKTIPSSFHILVEYSGVHSTHWPMKNGTLHPPLPSK